MNRAQEQVAETEETERETVTDTGAFDAGVFDGGIADPIIQDNDEVGDGIVSDTKSYYDPPGFDYSNDDRAGW